MKQVFRSILAVAVVGLLGGQLYIATLTPPSAHAEGDPFATPTFTPTPVVEDGDCHEVFC